MKRLIEKNCIFAAHFEKRNTMSVELSEQEIIRRKKLQDLLDLGIDPYPAATYEVNATTAEILENYPKDNSL